MKSVRVAALLSVLLAASPAWAVKPFTADYEASVMGGISARVETGHHQEDAALVG